MTLVFYSDKMLNINPARRQTRLVSASKKVQNQAQRKRPTINHRSRKRRAAWPEFSLSEESDRTMPPCHRDAPRTAEQAEAFLQFTANLGKRVATCVSETGSVQHLYTRVASLFLVTEALSFRDRQGVSRDLHCAVSDFGCVLSDFVKKERPGVFHRVFDFEPVEDEHAARWAMRVGVSDQLPEWLRRRMWGNPEGMSRVCSWKECGSNGPIHVGLYNQGGHFMLMRNQEPPARISWEDARQLVRVNIVIPALQCAVPSVFTGEFGLEGGDEREGAASPDEVLTP